MRILIAGLVLFAVALFGCPEAVDGGQADASLLGQDGAANAADGSSSPDASAFSPDAGRPDASLPIPSDAGSGAPCGPLTVESGVSVSGYRSDRYNWRDVDCQPRSAALVRNDARDPGGTYGGHMREYRYQADGKQRVCAGSSGTDWNGWGYVVNHYGSGAATSHDTAGTYRTVFAGKHHALHEYQLTVSPGAPVKVVIHWLFATGRSDPLYSITFDVPSSSTVNADTRAPYGNLDFDGAGGEVMGVGWGDRYKFATTGAGPVTMGSAWDYTQPNTIPSVVEWTTGVDAEMGVVETRPFLKTLSGGDYGGGGLADCWTHTSNNPGKNCSKDNAGDAMFAAWLWPYQLNQYELPFVTTSKRLCWGANYGAVGLASYDSLGRSGLVGKPRVSYAVFVVLDRHRDAGVARLVQQMETVQATTLTASVGTVAASGVAGVGRADTTTWSPPGWNHVYATWDLQAAANAASARMAVGGGSLVHPVVRLLGYTGSLPSSVTLGGAALQADVDYFASVDAANHVLWLTLNRTVAGTVDLAIR